MNIGPAKTQNLMALLGGIILAGVVLYFLLNALNRYGMQERKGTASVVEKTFQASRQDHLPNGTINVTPDTYLLRLRVENNEDEIAVDKDIYDAVKPNDTVSVTFTRLRFTGGISVTGVRH